MLKPIPSASGIFPRTLSSAGSHLTSSNSNNALKQAKYLDYRGLILMEQHRYNAALSKFRRALRLKRDAYDTDLRSEVAVSYRNVGAAAYMLGDFRDALQNHQEALRIRVRLRDPKAISDSYRNIGVTYRDLSGRTSDALANLHEALAYIHRAQRQAGSLEGGNAGVPLRGRDRENEIDGYKLREATIDFDLGLTYEQIGNLKEALRYHRKALRIRRQQLNHQEGNLELSEAAVRQLEMRLNSPV